MLSAYARLFGRRGVPQLTAAGLLTRLGTPVLSLAMLLVAVERLGSYTTAGLMLTGHALALALCAPVGGRLADRHGPRRVLSGFLVAHALAYGLLLITLAIVVPAPVLIADATLLGATTPPASAVVRDTWPRLAPQDLLRTAYTLDNASNELAFIVGPVLVAALLLVMSAQLVVATAGAAVLLGVIALLVSPSLARKESSAAVGQPTPATRRPGRLFGPLTHRSTLLLLAIAACGTFTFGCLRIATVASATAFETAGSAGVLMGLLSAGALVGAVLYGARAGRMTGRRTLILLYLAEATVLLVAGFAASILVLALLITVIGLLSGPRESVEQVLLAQQAPAQQRTEVFSWLNTFMWGGYGLGTAVAGRLTGPAASGTAAMTAAAVIALLAAILAVTRYRPQRDSLTVGQMQRHDSPIATPVRSTRNYDPN